ncbi:hypothetical protein BDV93DRAFT_553059 [Ceratobasidium sp. AG-I]|nr:hypothetical protein BDV93DRAFT_553059 [Ceratobasidium sp. AG-I]
MTSRSTLGVNQHVIPPFYACYLLKSVKTKSSRSTYVGSTPDPPRRIRQHNGELTQGAYKTKRGRPWVMTMIVHGFPSKLAALQFEWAWQHPYMSRHLRESETTQKGKQSFSYIFKRDGKANLLKTKILVARTMLPLAPYNTWPLHVKIFTGEAKKLWDEVQRPGLDAPLPRGFTYTVEYEGVDGKAQVETAQRADARTGPIDVKDTKFTLSHLDKYQALANDEAQRSCSICNKAINVKRINHLAVSLCPHKKCFSLSHLTCLASSFRKNLPNSPLMPRGGTCSDCNKYVLWGDVVRGCYRRARGGLEKPASENEMDEEEEEEEAANTGDELSMRLDALRINDPPQLEPQPEPNTRPASPRTKPAKRPKAKPAPEPKVAPKPKRAAKKALVVCSDVEDFAAEMDAVNCTTEESGDNLPTSRSRAPAGKTDSAAPKALKATKKKQVATAPSDVPAATTTTKAKAKTKTAKKAVPQEPIVPSQNSDSNLDETVRRVLGELSLSSPEIAPVSAPKKVKSSKAKDENTADPLPKAPKPTSTKVRPRMKIPSKVPEDALEIPPIAPATKPLRSKKTRWVDVSDDEAGGVPSYKAHATAIPIPSIDKTKVRKRRSPSPEFIDLRGI